MNTKKCQHCYSEENLYNYKNTTGHSYYICKKCSTENMRKYRLTKKGKKATNKAVKKSINKYRYKHNARVLLRWGVIKGKVIKSNFCEECKEKKVVEGHHLDYLKPLSVIWLCRNCHNLIHKSITI